jgi:cold-inducible RNA-binding protein
MGKRLYVGNLPFSTTEEQLSTLFNAQYKVTSAKLIVDKYSGRSKGFGFVEIADDTQASDAITKLNGSDVEGRKIVVNEARPMGERRPGGPGGGFGGGFGGDPGGGRQFDKGRGQHRQGGDGRDRGDRGGDRW